MRMMDLVKIVLVTWALVFALTIIAHSQTPHPHSVREHCAVLGWPYDAKLNACVAGVSNTHPLAPCGYPAALHKDGRCHEQVTCPRLDQRAVPVRVRGVWTLDCTSKPGRGQP